MPKLQTINDNIFRKINTEADYNRALGVLRDKIVIINSQQAESRIVQTGFKYLPGAHELEVYINGTYVRVNETINDVSYGTYDENSNFTVRFNSGAIYENDIVRFRVTSAHYKILDGMGANDIKKLNNNLIQLASDTMGTKYSFKESVSGSERLIGQFGDGQTAINLSEHRTWYTSNSGAIVTHFTGCRQDDIRHIIFKNNLTTITGNGNIRFDKDEFLRGNTDQVVTFMFSDGLWKQISNSYQGLKKQSVSITELDWFSNVDYNLYEVDITELNDKNILFTCFDTTSEEQIQVAQFSLYNNFYSYLRMPRNADQVIRFMATISDTQNTINLADWTLSGNLYYADINLVGQNALESLVSCFEYETNAKIEPTEIQILDSTHIRIWMLQPVLMLVLTADSDFVNTITNLMWTLDEDSGDYYFDNDISGMDSTAIVTYFYDNSTKMTLLPKKVELIDSNTLRVWMPDNSMSVMVLLNKAENMSVEIQLSSSNPLKIYSATLFLHMGSTDFVINGINMVTNTAIVFGSEDYDFEVINNNTMRIWSNFTSPIKVVVIE